MAAESPKDLRVCAKASWKSLPFLGKATPAEKIMEIIQSKEQAYYVSYLKNVILQKAAPSIAFLAAAAICLLVFFLWRLFRWCCVTGCCRDSYDARRAQNDGRRILRSKRMAFFKAAALLFSTASIIMSIVGISQARRDVTTEVWGVVEDVKSFALDISSRMDDLKGSAENITAILNDVSLMIVEDVNIAELTTNIQAVNDFLVTIKRNCNPTLMTQDLDSLNNDMTDLTSDLTDLQTKFGNLEVEVNDLKAALGTMQGAPVLITTMKSAMQSLQTATQNLPASPPNVGSLEGPISTVQSGYAPANLKWSKKLDDVLLAVSDIDDYKTTHPGLSGVLSSTSAVTVIAAKVSTTAARLSAALGAFTTAYPVAAPSMAALLSRFDHMNMTITSLEHMKDDVRNLEMAGNTLKSFNDQNPSPSSLKGQLDALVTKIASIPDVSSLNTLTNSLPDFSGIVTPVQNIRNLVNSFEGPFNSLKDKFDDFKASGAQQDYDDLHALTRNAASYQTPENALVVALGSTSIDTSGVSTAQSALDNSATTITTFRGFVTQALSSRSSVGDLQSITNTMKAVEVEFSKLGSDPTLVTFAAKVILRSMEGIFNKVLKDAQEEVDGVTIQLDKASSKIQVQVVDKIQDFRTKQEDDFQKYESYLYIGTVAIFSVCLVLLFLLLICMFTNYRAGLNILTFMLLLALVLYFLISLLVAVVLVVLNDGCSQMEVVAKEFTNNSTAALADYYLYHQGDSVRDVLKAAGVVDIDKSTDLVKTARDSVINAMKEKFVLRAKPLVLLDRINATVDYILNDVNDLVDMASYEEVTPLYLKVKRMVCCMAGNMMGSIWTTLTYSGLLALAASVWCFIYIGRLDRLPRKDCCGCTCLRAKMYDNMQFINSGPQLQELYLDQAVARVMVMRREDNGEPKEQKGGELA